MGVTITKRGKNTFAGSIYDLCSKRYIVPVGTVIHGTESVNHPVTDEQPGIFNEWQAAHHLSPAKRRIVFLTLPDLNQLSYVLN
ncbi:MAG: hypothetical protein BWX93_01886 [Bacteroidetes bacterium ADurb.Bin139]|nr:MAG: hypothetical protein BWX93_01886 [Bacteroidetes bacterium ADurb.Bin139]